MWLALLYIVVPIMVGLVLVGMFLPITGKGIFWSYSKTVPIDFNK